MTITQIITELEDVTSGVKSGNLTREELEKTLEIITGNCKEVAESIKEKL